MGSIIQGGAGFGVALVLSAYAAPALAQTWSGSRTTPSLSEIVAIDRTGEDGWLYGHEDLAGDDPDFKQQEQSIDIRTAYASTDAADFWVRVYVSDPNGVGGNVSVYVFVDSDESAATGGPAEATDIDPVLVGDPSPGGYEYIIGIRGNASISGIWEWRDPQAVWTEIANIPAAQASAEAGQDTDPIQINGLEHGYLQATVAHALIGLTQACDANLFVRSANESAIGTGDLDVGEAGSCVPVDTTGDGVPDVVVPTEGCTDDAQCPGGGICVGGECLLAEPCLTDADCGAGRVCDDAGHCVPEPGGPCDDNTACTDLACVAGTCQSCTTDPTACGPGTRCAPDGRCVTDSGSTGAGGAGGGLGLQPGDEVQGGACTCDVPGSPTRPARQSASWWLLASIALAVSLRHRGTSRPGA